MPPARRPAAKKANGASAPKQENNKVEVIFDQDRETKGTFRFKEDANDNERPVMGSVYLRKDIYELLGVGDTDNNSIKITVEAYNE